MATHQHNLSTLFAKIESSGNKMISVELCPNRDLNTEALDKLSPAFCAVMWPTYSDNVLNEVPKLPSVLLSKQLSLQGNHVLVHLVGRHLTKLQALNILIELQRIEVRNLFVLQGDPVQEDEDKYDFRYASDLIKFVRQNFGSYFCIGVAAYPDVHPLALTKASDLKYLKMKVESGADFIITRMVFDCEVFSQFLEECKGIGINVPIIPGISIISSYDGLCRTAKFCSVQVPRNVVKVVTDNRENPEAIRNYGVFQCTQLAKQLLLIQDMQVLGVHFFSFNNVKLVNEVCRNLGLCDVYVERPISNKCFVYNNFFLTK